MGTTPLGSHENVKVGSSSSTSLSIGKVILVIGVVFGFLLAILLNFFVLNQPYTYQGSLIDPPLPAKDFRLNDQNGNVFTLSHQSGNVVLLFFGYTHCPDVCPITLYEYKQIRQQLGERAEKVKFVFITVDPERDNSETLKEHLSNFDPAILGLSGNRSVLEKVWEDYGITQVKREVNSNADYLVDHTARMYVIDKTGSLRITYPFGYEIEKIVADLDNLLREDED